jgi:hypothetical protein
MTSNCSVSLSVVGNRDFSTYVIEFRKIARGSCHTELDLNVRVTQALGDEVTHLFH